MTNAALEKVTIFVTRGEGAQRELLLFQHQSAGIQIPAGTVEFGETPEQAAVRETAEETALEMASPAHFLGVEEDEAPAGHCFVYQTSPICKRPDTKSLSGASVRRGIAVEIEREEGEFVQISYREFQRQPPPEQIFYQITGWVLRPALIWRRRRSFYQFDYTEQTPERWTTNFDGPAFELFWAQLDDLPDIVPPQAAWLAYL